MPSSSRAPRPVLAALSLLAALALAGCGGGSETTSGANPTAPATPAPSSTTATDTTSPAPSPTASSDRVQVIAVEKYGISFELPKGWLTLDAKNVLKDGSDSPIIKELADRLGASPDQLVQTFSTAVQTMSVSDDGAVHGFVDNVNTVGQEGAVNDDQVKLQLATIGAKPGEITHAGSPAGDVTRVPYTLPTKTGPIVRAVALAVRTGTATVVVTISSSTAARAGAIADQVQESLQPLPGGGSGP